MKMIGNLNMTKMQAHNCRKPKITILFILWINIEHILAAPVFDKRLPANAIVEMLEKGSGIRIAKKPY